MYNNFSSNETSNKPWRDQLDYFLDEKSRFSKQNPIMTQFERMSVKEGLDMIQAKIKPSVVTGALSEFEAKINNFRAASTNTAKAIGTEIMRWDAKKLSDEIQLTTSEVTEALKTPFNPISGESKLGRMQGIVEQALQSGDMYKIRAAATCVRNAADKVDHSDRLQMTMLTRAVETQLENIRKTPEIDRAIEEQNKATRELQDARDELGAISTAFDERPGPFVINEFTKAMKRVKVTQDGLSILDENDPEVTGIGVIGNG
jgi:hypothetical protein